MVTNLLTEYSLQSWATAGGNLLVSDETLAGRVQFFLLSCKIDGLAPDTRRSYRQNLLKFVAFCESMQISRPELVTTNRIRLFIEYLQTTNKPASVADYEHSIKRFFNWLIGEKVVKENPMDPLRPPTVHPPLIKPFTVEEINKLLEVCDRDPRDGVRNKAIILTFLDTGVRLRELISIKLADVDIEAGIIKVMGKGAKERNVCFGNLCRRALIEYVTTREHKSEWLFLTSQYGLPYVKGNALSHLIRILGRRAGLSGVRCSPHTFRHTFATMFLVNAGAKEKAGAGQMELQTLLGHSTQKMTKLYTSTVQGSNAVAAHRQFSPVDNMKRTKRTAFGA